ncbi:hypothetical protein CQ018_08225 [Arthrobacter sp. MYb227]|uniref:hypothetical protein n=1 Tax=Arthrobacter sp. MYb227 TaxID=1848601 RepID=UPI000CFC53A9|nr:hypothetical protein [Arthrobacter sp. MYb227]PQZ93640.1 hypothetical protein CQ018_08225 [Arthrobacter sp. MYb227]
MPTSSTTYTFVRPSAEAWQGLPRRQTKLRQNVVAVSIALLTTIAAFVVDRGWATFDEDAFLGPYRTIDMYGLAGLYLAVAFSLGGWAMGRLAVPTAPLVLACAAVPHMLDGYASAPFWWAGAILASLWFAIQLRDSVREVLVVSALAHACATAETAIISASAQSTIRRILLKSTLPALISSIAAVASWVFTYMSFADEQGLTYQELQEESVSDFFAAGALAASILAPILWGRFVWRIFSRSFCGNNLWVIPSDAGPVEPLPQIRFHDNSSIPSEVMDKATDCTCLMEHLRANPEYEGDDDCLLEYGIEPSVYCPAHGIDAINSLDHTEFRAAVTAVWLWDEDTLLPLSNIADADRSLLLGYSGHGFTGLAAVKSGTKIDIRLAWDELVDERGKQEAWDYGHGPSRPQGGVFDTIDLRLAGFDGQAVRYTHGRAWFEPTSQKLRSLNS